MEIHHPHIEHREKPWKEYLLEGLMIFIAVTLGFIAENIRENLTELNKKKELLETVGLDFSKDLDQLNYHEKFANEKLNACTNFMSNVDGNHILINQKNYYHDINTIKGWWYFNSEEKSRNEAESKGYFYTKENSELANAIIRFNFFKNDYKNAERHEEILIEKYNEEMPYLSDFNLFLKQNRYPEPAFNNTSTGVSNIDKSHIVKTKYIISEMMFYNDVYLDDIDSMRLYANKAIEIIKKQYK